MTLDTVIAGATGTFVVAAVNLSLIRVMVSRFLFIAGEKRVGRRADRKVGVCESGHPPERSGQGHAGGLER